MYSGRDRPRTSFAAKSRLSVDSLEAAIRDYAKARTESGQPPSTFRREDRALAMFADYWWFTEKLALRRMSDLTPDDLQRFMAHQIQRGCSLVTAQRRLARLRPFLQWCKRAGRFR